MTEEERAILGTVEIPEWLECLVRRIRWCCVPWQLTSLARKLTPELINSMSPELANDWYYHLANQYTLIFAFRTEDVITRMWISSLRRCATRLDCCIVCLWERSQPFVKQQEQAEEEQMMSELAESQNRQLWDTAHRTLA